MPTEMLQGSSTNHKISTFTKPSDSYKHTLFVTVSNLGSTVTGFVMFRKINQSKPTAVKKLKIKFPESTKDEMIGKI